METLAYTHVAVEYEELNSCSELRAFRNIKIQALKVVKFIAIAAGGITTSLVLGTTSQASTNQIRNSTATNGRRVVPSHTGVVVTDTKGIVSDPPITPLIAAPSRQQNKHYKIGTASTTVVGGNTKKVEDRTFGKESYGKLTLVNDTPTPKLIYLIPPSSGIPKRYAFVTGCTSRKLNKSYSTGWRFTTDMSSSTGIKTTPSDGQLEARASSLEKEGGVECMSVKEYSSRIKGSATAKSYYGAPRYSYADMALYIGTLRSAGSHHPAELAFATEQGIKKPQYIAANIEKQCARLKQERCRPELLQLSKYLSGKCQIQCSTTDANNIITITMNIIEQMMKSQMETEIQHLGQNNHPAPPNKEVRDQRRGQHDFLVGLVNAAMDTSISDEDAKRMIRHYLLTICAVLKEENVNVFTEQWTTYRVAWQHLYGAIRPMPNGALYASKDGTYERIERPGLKLAEVTSGPLCLIKEPAGNQYHKRREL